MRMLKVYIKILLPKLVFNYLKKIKSKYYELFYLHKAYLIDLKRYYKYSDFNKQESQTNLISLIIQKYHVVEKGLTMPETRLGFGKDLIISLCIDCNKYVAKFGLNDGQLAQAVSVLIEYKEFHENKKYKLDQDILSSINNTLKFGIVSKNLKQIQTNKLEFFSKTSSNFKEFSNSRSSIRNFTTENIPIEKIEEVIELARNTPSACNRQAWRTNVYTNSEEIRKILSAQGGNRGFGHLSNKLIVISSEIGLFCGLKERNQAFIDGGMYAMNILYSLHFHEIGACILNCSFAIETETQMRELCKLKESEVFIAMIACGIPPLQFQVAASKRYNIDHTNKIK